MSQPPNYEVLTFKRCSSNAAITNNGRILEKLQLGKTGSGFTSRPLNDDEVFTVLVNGNDEKCEGFGPAIGLTTLTLEGQDLEEHSNNYKSGTWMLYSTHLYQNGSAVNQDYLKRDLKTLQFGQTLGVTRTRYGTLHFFMDGVDQGPAASNLPPMVYGIFELRGSKQGTIVDV